MENFENNESRIRRLFDLAKQDEPVMHLDEARQIISTGHFAKMNGGHWLSGKYFILMGLVFVGALSFILITSMRQNEPEKVRDNSIGTTNSAVVAISPVTEKTIEPVSIVNSKPNELKIDIKNTSSATEVKSKTIAGESVNKKAISSQKVTWYYDGNARVQYRFEGSNVELIANDKLINLIIDGEKISESDYGLYSELIAEGMKLKDAEEAKRKAADNKLSAAELQKKEQDSKIMKAFIETLRADGLIGEDEKFEFRLTGTEVLLNNKSLGTDAFEKYKSVYEKTSGNPLTAKANIRIKH